MKIEIITIDEEIKIIGLSFKKSGLTRSYESLKKIWDIYGEKHRINIKNAVVPTIEYGVCDCLLTDNHEYIAGCAVTEIGILDENWTSFVVPSGKYVKQTSPKQEYLFTEDINVWAEKNDIKLNGNFMIEVYPEGVFEGKDIEIFILHQIQDE